MSFNRVFRAATLQIKAGYITSYRHMPQLWPERTSVYFLSLQSVYLFSFQSFFCFFLSNALHPGHWTGPAFHVTAVSTITEAELAAAAAAVLLFVKWIISESRIVSSALKLNHNHNQPLVTADSKFALKGQYLDESRGHYTESYLYVYDIYQPLHLKKNREDFQTKSCIWSPSPPEKSFRDTVSCVLVMFRE